MKRPALVKIVDLIFFDPILEIGRWIVRLVCKEVPRSNRVLPMPAGSLFLLTVFMIFLALLQIFV